MLESAAMDLGAQSAPRVIVVAALLFACLVAAALPSIRRLLSRGPAPISLPEPDARVWRDATLVLLGLAVALVGFTAGSYGYNVDEWFQANHAAALFEWYRDAFSHGRVSEFHAEVDAMKHYGGGFELLAEVASRISPGDPTGTRHLLTAWTGVLGGVAVYGLGCVISCRAAGFTAVLLLLLTPSFTGHFVSNPKDVPFATAMTFALLAICRSLPQLPRLPARQILLTGLAIGLAASVRVGGLISLLYFCLALAWSLGDGLRTRRAELLRDLLGLVGAGLGVLAVAWIVMLVFWPWALAEPLLRPVQALGYFQDIVDQQQVDFTVLFEGARTRLSELPRYFTLKSLLLTMPEFALLAPLLLVAPLLALRHAKLDWPSARAMTWVLCASAIALPLAMTASDGLIQYDGIRHFLFVLPPIAVCFAAGLVATLRSDISARFKAGLFAATIALALVTAIDSWRLRPYEYVYYNRSVAGGLRSAAQSYETDYLGLSFREGFSWLVDNYPTEPGRSIRVAGCPGFHVNLEDAAAHAGRAGAGFRPVRPKRNPQLALAFTRSQCNQRYRGRVLGTIGRDGVPLLYILELR